MRLVRLPCLGCLVPPNRTPVAPNRICQQPRSSPACCAKSAHCANPWPSPCACGILGHLAATFLPVFGVAALFAAAGAKVWNLSLPAAIAAMIICALIRGGHALRRTVHEPQCRLPPARAVPVENVCRAASPRARQTVRQRQRRPDRAGHHRRRTAGNLLRAHHFAGCHRHRDHRALHGRIAYVESCDRCHAGHRAPDRRHRAAETLRHGGRWSRWGYSPRIRPT